MSVMYGVGMCSGAPPIPLLVLDRQRSSFNSSGCHSGCADIPTLFVLFAGKNHALPCRTGKHWCRYRSKSDSNKQRASSAIVLEVARQWERRHTVAGGSGADGDSSNDAPITRNNDIIFCQLGPLHGPNKRRTHYPK